MTEKLMSYISSRIEQLTLENDSRHRRQAMDAGISGFLGAVLGAAVTGVVAIYLRSQERRTARRDRVAPLYLEFLARMRELVENEARIAVIRSTNDRLGSEIDRMRSTGNLAPKEILSIQAKSAKLVVELDELTEQISTQEQDTKSTVDKLVVSVQPEMLPSAQRLLNSLRSFQSEPTPENREAYSESERLFLLAARANAQ